MGDALRFASLNLRVLCATVSAGWDYFWDEESDMMR